MIDNLLGLVQQFAGDAIKNNPDVPNEKNNAVVESVAEGLLNGFKNQASSSNGIGQILNLFGGSGDSNSITKSIQTSVISSLMDKAGIKNDLAKNIAGQVVPLVVSVLSDPKKNNINAASLLGSITGGGKSGGVDVQGLLDTFAGGDDGKFDLGDVANMLGKFGKKDDNSSTDSGDGGGILGALGGLFGGKK